MADRVRGYLTVTVVEASGKTKEDEIVWEDHFQEGFVKGTIRDALQLQMTTVSGIVCSFS